MRSYEWLATGYFIALAAAAPLTSAPRARRLAVCAAAAFVAAVVSGVAHLAPSAARDWLPSLYLVTGYWMPALLVPRAGPRPDSPVLLRPEWFEPWLMRTDRRVRARLPALPPVLIHVVELAYLVCYPLVPISFAIVWMLGTSADAERFWESVLLSGYTCYATIPWLVSRPPRLAGLADYEPRSVAALNVLVLRQVSHQLNTFPSGHVAVSFAAAASVAFVSAPAGVVVGVTAAAISIGAVVGRYHYVADVVLGVLVAAFAAGVVT